METVQQQLGRALPYYLVVAGIALNGLMSAANSLRSVRAATWPAPNDWMVKLDETFGRARPYIGGRREIGYVTSIPNEKLMTIGYGDETARYFIAQYALAPTVLSRTPGPPMLFTDFPNEVALRDFANRNLYAIVWNKGGTGVLESQSR
jgi:hypothetical protein